MASLSCHHVAVAVAAAPAAAPAAAASAVPAVTAAATVVPAAVAAAVAADSLLTSVSKLSLWNRNQWLSHSHPCSWHQIEITEADLVD